MNTNNLDFCPIKTCRAIATIEYEDVDTAMTTTGPVDFRVYYLTCGHYIQGKSL